jgi:hypothetical protein
MKNRKMIKVLIGLFICTFLLSCQANNKSSTKPINKNDSINTIQYATDNFDSNKIQFLFNQTKWMMYLKTCQDTLKFWPNLKIRDTVLFSQLPLKLLYIKEIQDSIDFEFTFFYKDTIPCTNELLRMDNMILSGALYKKGSDTLVYYCLFNGLYAKNYYHNSFFFNPNDTFKNSIEPSIINFLNNNRSKLNPWFLNEAIKRAVLKL